MSSSVAVEHETTGPRLATRLSFFAAGFAMACWAPLIPFAKRNVGADDAQLGLLLLCLGIGSVVAMPATGWISARFGARPMILAGGVGLVLFLPCLVLADSPASLAAALFLFGASLGTIDVAMNVHGVEVEHLDRRPLMSGFHAMFSIGGFAGSAGTTALLASGLSPLPSALVGSSLTLGALFLAASRLLRARGGGPLPFAVPSGIVVLLAVLSGIVFLVEGAVLDWSALLIVDMELADTQRAGLGYMLFSIAMVVGRLTGDRVVSLLGARKVLVVGGALMVVGIAVLLAAQWRIAAFTGFVLIGLGAANLVPVLFSLAGRQTVMPVGLAIAAVTTTGYAGILLGPAAIGLVSHLTSLPTAFWLLAVFGALVPLSAISATR